jgi:uncharacterized protein YndB with AHSA1/START domain
LTKRFHSDKVFYEQQEVNMASAFKTVLVSVSMLLIVLLAASAGPAVQAKEKQMSETKKYFMTTGLMIRKAVEVPASVDDVWHAWTSKEGVKTFFAQDASVELAVNGDYEMYFDPKQPAGLRGSEGCRVLGFVPGEMFSFTWNAPPTMPNVRKERTWVVIHFQALEAKKTRVSMVHLGWQAGEEWKQALQYFHKAWDVVLARLHYRFQTGPIDWKDPFTPVK